jgi:hypothetical protein
MIEMLGAATIRATCEDGIGNGIQATEANLYASSEQLASVYD